MNRPHSPFSLGSPGPVAYRQEQPKYRSLPNLELIEVTYPERILDIGKFRIEGWRNEKGVDPDFFAQKTWLDELDKKAKHWIVTDGEEIVAAARLSLHDSLDDVPYADMLTPEHQRHFESRKLASLNRLVVAPEYRGHGLSGQLDAIRIESAKALGAE
ncbi:GNAT family N-acetyltransferase, partial [Persicitalea sp.]|uniref:GNAT family N-acetyltransferase n=1 Tax=Persicitalea sp. TaxID=3100273 RepID=UPI0035935C04